MRKIKLNQTIRMDVPVEVLAEMPEGVSVLARAPRIANPNPEGRIVMSLADNLPFEHWFRTKLSMERKSIVADRVRAGTATMLYRHNDYIGRIEALGVKDGVLYTENEFSPRIPLALEVQGEVQDGRLRGVSLGANILEAELYEDEDGEYMLDIGKWEFVEGSITPTPANGRVGIQSEGLKVLSALKAEMALMAAEETEAQDEGTEEEIETETVEVTTMPEEQVVETSVESGAAYQDYVMELTDLATTLKAEAHLPGAIRANMSADQFRKAYGVEDTPESERVSHAQAKAAADFGQFNLQTLFLSMENKGNPELRAAAEPSYRCIEQLRASTPADVKYNPTHGGVMVPWELLVAEQWREDRMYAEQYNRARGRLNAAVTTTGTLTGLTQEELRPEAFLEMLMEENAFLGLCSVISGLDRNIAIPYTNTIQTARERGEGTSTTTPDTFEVLARDTSPKQLSVYWSWTPEAEVNTEGLVERFGMSEAFRSLANQSERQLFRGDGTTAGHVTGFEASVGTNSADYTNANGPTVKEMRELARGMNNRLFPRGMRGGRVYAISPRMGAYLDRQAQVASVSALMRDGMMFPDSPDAAAPAIETTHMTESSAMTDGRAMLIAARSQLVAFYGTAAEVVAFTDPDSHERRRGILQLWHSAPLRTGLVQRVKET